MVYTFFCWNLAISSINPLHACGPDIASDASPDFSNLIIRMTLKEMSASLRRKCFLLSASERSYHWTLLASTGDLTIVKYHDQ